MRLIWIFRRLYEFFFFKMSIRVLQFSCISFLTNLSILRIEVILMSIITMLIILFKCWICSTSYCGTSTSTPDNVDIWLSKLNITWSLCWVLQCYWRWWAHIGIRYKGLRIFLLLLNQWSCMKTTTVCLELIVIEMCRGYYSWSLLCLSLIQVRSIYIALR